MGDTKIVEFDLADKPLIQQVVRATKLAKNLLRSPRVGPTADDTTCVKDREPGLRASTLVENADPSVHPLRRSSIRSGYLEVEFLFEQGLVLGPQEHGVRHLIGKLLPLPSQIESFLGQILPVHRAKEVF